MKAIALSVLAVALAACGGDPSAAPGTAQGAAIELAGTVETNTKSVEIRIYAPRDKDKIVVSCTSLITGNPFDDRYDVLQSSSFPYPAPDGTMTVTGIKANDAAVVYVEALDASSTVIGEGCRDDFKIEGGKTEDLTIIVYAAT